MGLVFAAPQGLTESFSIDKVRGGLLQSFLSWPLLHSQQQLEKQVTQSISLGTHSAAGDRKRLEHKVELTGSYNENSKDSFPHGGTSGVSTVKLSLFFSP